MGARWTVPSQVESAAALQAILEATKDPEAPIAPPALRPRNGHGRKALPAHLPREQVVHRPSLEELVCATS